MCCFKKVYVVIFWLSLFDSLPKTQILRDFNWEITSCYSNGPLGYLKYSFSFFYKREVLELVRPI